jgi:hypothetical protein
MPCATPGTEGAQDDPTQSDQSGRTDRGTDAVSIRLESGSDHDPSVAVALLYHSPLEGESKAKGR